MINIMNLYKITFIHYSPKDNECGIKALVLSNSDEDVYEWIKSEPETMEGKLSNSWIDNEMVSYNADEDLFIDEYGAEVLGWYDEDGNAELFKDRMIRLRGEINDDEIELSDLYYGLTLLGWELVKECVSGDYSELINCCLVHRV